MYVLNDHTDYDETVQNGASSTFDIKFLLILFTETEKKNQQKTQWGLAILH